MKHRADLLSRLLDPFAGAAPLSGKRRDAPARAEANSFGRRDLQRRFDRLTSELGLDHDRARGWTIGQTIAWSFDTSYLPQHVQLVQWLLESS